jgi:acetyltransferase-like isoleucine patch superfamily enzyme
MGNHNRIVIGRDTFLICAELWISKDENRITVGKNSTIQGKLEYPIHLAAIEGTAIEIGQECMISAAVEIRTADGHSITNLEGKRINPSKSVRIGNHVWIGSGASCTKGIEITDHCIVGTKSVVTRSIEKSYCVVGGNPARIIKEGVDWQKELLEISE